MLRARIYQQPDRYGVYRGEVIEAKQGLPDQTTDGVMPSPSKADTGAPAPKRKAASSPERQATHRRPHSRHVDWEAYERLLATYPVPKSPTPSPPPSPPRSAGDRHSGCATDSPPSRPSSGSTACENLSMASGAGERVREGFGLDKVLDTRTTANTPVLSSASVLNRVQQDVNEAKEHAVSRGPPGKGSMKSTSPESKVLAAAKSAARHAQIPTPLRKGRKVWIPWHGGCFYRATVTEMLPDKGFRFQYAKSHATIRLGLKDVRPNYQEEGTSTVLVASNSNAAQCYVGRLMLAFCKTLGVFIPGRITAFYRTGVITDKQSDKQSDNTLSERVRIEFIHVLQITETVQCSGLKTMSPTSATKLDADGNPLYPRLYHTHHPSFAKLQLLGHSWQTKPSTPATKRVGTLVLAKWPESNQYQLGVVDPALKEIREEVLARVDESLVMELPDMLPSPPYPSIPSGKKGPLESRRRDEAEREWRSKQLWEEAELTEGQWVAANWRRSLNREQADFHVLGQVRKQDFRGYYVEIIGRGANTRPVMLQRHQMRPLYRDQAVVFAQGGSPVWPEVIHKNEQVKKPKYQLEA
ncbi:hypothetical protein B0A55_01594 [Friedmanniomyces simplex]|uniref:Uncharacterized protein n=1 Tax=Friedmanniomyces simplex TaxID=329884 RepID=A0A4U0XVM7_9PEZI|nr:hypothetical protein B0A55_01594 [Friedmanniomyces simplex]